MKTVKVKKLFYLEENVAQKLDKLGRQQSEFVNAVLKDLFGRVSEEDVVVYRVKNDGFEGFLDTVCREGRDEK